MFVVEGGEHYGTVARTIDMHLSAEARVVDVVVATNEDIERHRGTPYDVIERHRTKVACCMAAPARGTDPATAENQ